MVRGTGVVIPSGYRSCPNPQAASSQVDTALLRTGALQLQLGSDAIGPTEESRHGTRFVCSHCGSRTIDFIEAAVPAAADRRPQIAHHRALTSALALMQMQADPVQFGFTHDPR